MNDELGKILEAGVVACPRYYSGSCLQELGKPTKKLKINGCSAKIRVKHIPNRHIFHDISQKTECMKRILFYITGRSFSGWFLLSIHEGEVLCYSVSLLFIHRIPYKEKSDRNIKIL
jgi:hypothetical protein